MQYEWYNLQRAIRKQKAEKNIKKTKRVDAKEDERTNEHQKAPLKDESIA